MSTVLETLKTGLQLILPNKIHYAYGSITPSQYASGDTVVIQVPANQIYRAYVHSYSGDTVSRASVNQPTATTTNFALTDVPANANIDFTVEYYAGIPKQNISITPSVLPIPVITVQPDATLAEVAPAAAAFSVTATGHGTSTLTYQWYKAATNVAGVLGTAIVGATSATYTLDPTVAVTSNGYYSVVVSNASGSVTSTTCHLTVTSV